MKLTLPAYCSKCVGILFVAFSVHHAFGNTSTENNSEDWVTNTTSEENYNPIGVKGEVINGFLYSQPFDFTPTEGNYEAVINGGIFDDSGSIGGVSTTPGSDCGYPATFAGLPVSIPAGNISVIGNQLRVSVQAVDICGVMDGWQAVSITWRAKRKKCSTCSDTCTPGTPTIDDGCVHVSFDLGKDGYKQNAGQLVIRSDSPSLALATPGGLQPFVRTTVEQITDVGGLRQVRTAQVLADIVTSNAFCYVINFYTAADFSTNKVNGLYVPTGQPYSTFVIQNPDASFTTYNRLRVNQSGSMGTHQFDYVWVDSAQRWDLTTGGGLRTETRTKNWDVSQTVLTETNIIFNTDGSVAFKQIETYQAFPWGETNLVRRVVDPDGSLPQTNTWTYYTDSADPNNYKHLQQITTPSGYWERYTYDSLRVIKRVCQFQDVATNATDAQCRVTTYTYSGTGDPLQETMVETLLGQEVGRSYQLYCSAGSTNIVCQTVGAGLTNLDNLVTASLVYTSGPFQGQNYLTQNPDGTVQIYQYFQNANAKVTTVFSGVPDASGTNVIDGTKTISAVDLSGNSISNMTFDIASGSLLSSAITVQKDSFGRPTLVQYNDGTTETTQYGCCGIDSQTDREGIVTSYTYDDLKRLTAMTRNGITTLYTYDAMGRVLTTTRQGSDNSQVSQSVFTYNPAGRLIASTNALNYGTIYGQALDANGHTVKTTTTPDGGTRIETYFKDNSLMSVNGTAVLGLTNVYGMEIPPGESVYRAYTKEIKLNANGAPTSEWVKTYTDMAGRAYKTVYASATGSPASQSFYNNVGQLVRQVDPDDVTTLYQYNSKGQLAFTATDMDANTNIDFGGTDRITGTISDVTMDNGVVVNRTLAFAWNVNGSSTSNLVSLTETSTEGSQSWNVTFNNGIGITNRSFIDRIPAHGYRIVTSTAPDGSTSVSVYQYGRLISVTLKDASGTQIGQTVYGYDAHGRQNTITDARNGTSTTFFNNADQAVAIISPSPDGVQSGQVTTNYFDSVGRIWKTTLPDNTSVTNLYYTNGLLRQTYGSRTYPVAYTYDYAGRMKTMTTWTNFVSASGAAVTTWSYDGYRGFMTNKAYADGNGPAYTYTAAGRLASRTWERTFSPQHNQTLNVITSYTNNLAGELRAISYNDGSLPTVSYAYDRLGRQIAVTNGSAICLFAYNDAGELLSETYSGGPLNGLSVTNGYDSLLRRRGVALASQSATLTTFGYDAASRLQGVSNGVNSAMYSYLANSSLAGQITFRSNSVVRMTTTKQYDYLNRLTSISSFGAASSASPITFNYSYNTANQRTNTATADGSYWAYQYDALGQVTSGKKYWSDGTPVAGQQFTYNFDDIGNRRSTASGGDAAGGNLRSATYTNNALNQITGRTVPGYATVLGEANSNATVTVNLQRANRHGNYFRDELVVTNTGASIFQSLTNIAVLNNGTNADIVTTNQGSTLVVKTPQLFSYDPDGNLTNDGAFSYAWDDENRLTNMTSLSGIPTAAKLKLDFVYDYMGRRIQKTVSTNNGTSYVAQYTNRYVYDGWNLLAELGPGGSLIRSYVWGADLSDSMQGAGGVGGLLAVSYYGSQTTNCFVAYDGNGNVSALINAADGGTVANYEYGPFGEVLRANGQMAKSNPLRFSTKFQDDESDSLYYGCRYYTPSTGRWLSRDPIEERGGNNLYCCVRNNPENAIDPFGKDTNVPPGGDPNSSWPYATWPTDVGPPPSQSSRTFIDDVKYWGYRYWRNHVLTADHWREVMDNWYYETGPNPAIYLGNSDPRNVDIEHNIGFIKLLNCWIAHKRGEEVPASSEWKIDDSGFFWHYGYGAATTGFGGGAGGGAAIDGAMQFLGSYTARVKFAGQTGNKGTYAIEVYNRSGWTSGTRIDDIPVVDFIARRFGVQSAFSAHPRTQGKESPKSVGGDMEQYYIFTVEANPCAKCDLP